MRKAKGFWVSLKDFAEDVYFTCDPDLGVVVYWSEENEWVSDPPDWAGAVLTPEGEILVYDYTGEEEKGRVTGFVLEDGDLLTPPFRIRKEGDKAIVKAPEGTAWFPLGDEARWLELAEEGE
jgi:hypothetical protein